ncbi:DNA topoisomerase IB [Variovorax rhizosphaerae]|uniref:DNA topoisomerase n=1 Tax=Variovorax rhizosphaerae TaxID=1836200 RepID=A0ABU8WSD3_9BURK
MPATRDDSRLRTEDGPGLIYVRPDMPGFSRVKAGTRFRYRDTHGAWLQDAAQIARIHQLAIPPAYQRVWICPLANGHLQATGLDARGRTQYRYHAGWRAMKDQAKFDRLEAFGQALPRIRARVARDLRVGRGAPLERSLVLATLVRLLDTTFLRVGNDEYARSNGSFGLTTLRNRHADVRGGALTLRFRGKGGVMHEARVDDPRLAGVVRRCQQLPGQELFQYEDEDGTPRSISSTDVNEYLREAAPDGHFTAKDFRTWHGTVQALELTRLACSAPSSGTPGDTRQGAKEILAAVAARLGNTPAVCRKSYVHPAVLALGGSLAADAGAMNEIWKKITGPASGARRLLAAETRLLAFLRLQRRRESRERRNARQAAPNSSTKVESSRVTA